MAANPKPTKNFPRRPIHPIYEFLHTSKEKIEVRHNGIFPGSNFGGGIPEQVRFPGAIVTGVRGFDHPMIYYYDPELRIRAQDKAADVWSWVWADRQTDDEGYTWRNF